MGSASTKDYISTLNNLVETCRDGEQGYLKAAEDATRGDLKTLFTQYSKQRADFASELQMEVAQIGGEPAKGGSVAGAMHRGWIDVKAAVSHRTDHAILEEAERGEDAAKKAYQDALAKDLPSDLRAIVERQYQQVQQAHNNVRSLRDSGGSGSIPEAVESSRGY